MLKNLLLLCGTIAISQAKLGANDDFDYMVDSIDDLTAHFEGAGAEYNRTYYNKLKTCFTKYNDTLLDPSMRGAWKGIIDFYKSNGTSDGYQHRPDHWGNCIYNEDERCINTTYTEYQKGHEQHIGKHGILYYEPCNTISNMAYLRAVTRVCDYPDWAMNEDSQRTLKRSFAQLSAGSAFFHGSHTLVGFLYDNEMIAIIAYIAYQSQVNFIAGDEPILKYLQETPRKQSIDDIVTNISYSFRDADTQHWATVIEEADFPHDYFYTFAGVIYAGVSCVFPWFVATKILSVLTSLCLDDAQADFMTNKYLPALKPRIAKVKWSMATTINVLGKVLGVVIKIIYAFLWQEKYLAVPGINSPVGILVGATGMPWANAVSDALSGFAVTDYNVPVSEGVYPGEEKCKWQQAHTIWHEMSANGFMDLVLMCDYINKMTVYHYYE